MIVRDLDHLGYRSTNIDPFALGVFGTRQLTRHGFPQYLEKLNIRTLNIAAPDQVHGNRIEVIIKPAGEYQHIEADGLITSLRHVALSIVTADCVPLILVDPVKHLAGISHQGWKGIMAHLPSRMIEQFTRLGSNPTDIRAAIGPSINECCYEVSRDLWQTFREQFPKSHALHFVGSRYTINLQRLVFDQLSAAMPNVHIDHFPFCTKCCKEQFFSYRRGDGTARMLSFIISL